VFVLDTRKHLRADFDGVVGIEASDRLHLRRVVMHLKLKTSISQSA
jgi:hypothetical protein